MFTAARPGWAIDGQPLTAAGVRMEIARLSAVLRGLDLVDRDHPTWRPGPSARTLLPRRRAGAAADASGRAAPT